jgi:predicted DCC family thiol-disulfide oxidoreductase YuxK
MRTSASSGSSVPPGGVPGNAADPVATHAAAASSPTGASTGTAAAALPDAPLVLYDGDCGLCARSVQWILDHERDHAIVFAPLQGPTGAAARARYPRIPPGVDTVVFVTAGRVHLRSRAFLHIARHLRAPWRWGHALRWLPALPLDLLYRLVAAVRYRVWGHADACRRVSPAERVRFLS